jgi:hypothetical protein
MSVVAQGSDVEFADEPQRLLKRAIAVAYRLTIRAPFRFAIIFANVVVICVLVRVIFKPRPLLVGRSVASSSVRRNSCCSFPNATTAVSRVKYRAHAPSATLPSVSR